MSLEDAIQRAEDVGLDLIEVAAAADPPVCRIADLGKFKFEQDKRARDSKKNQHVSEVKEVRLRPRTDDHDLQVRVRAARRFLEEGHKVKVEVRFRGREATHPEVAREQSAHRGGRRGHRHRRTFAVAGGAVDVRDSCAGQVQSRGGGRGWGTRGRDTCRSTFGTSSSGRGGRERHDVRDASLSSAALPSISCR